MHIIFETHRLVLRRFNEQDAPLVLDLNSDPLVVKYVHEPVLQTREQAMVILLNIILPQYKDNLGRWAMHKKEDMAFIGWCGIKYRPDRDEMDLGYRLKRDAWGKGYATEAAQATLDHGFNELKLQCITGRAHVENLASSKVLEKIGMQFMGEGMVDECQVRTYQSLNPLLS